MNTDGNSTLHLKVVSLVIALTVFSLVASDRQTTRSFVFEVRLAETPAGFHLKSELPPVEATVRGPSREFSRIDPSTLQTIRIENVSPDQRVYRLRRSNFDLPTGLEVTDISPREISLDFEPMKPVEVRVRPVTRGEPGAGFVVGDVRAEPSTVTIRTPNGTWDGSSIPTIPIDIEGITEDLEETVELKILDYAIEFDEAATVSVFVAIDEQRETTELNDMPIQVTGPFEGEYELSHDSVKVTLEGPRETIGVDGPGDVFVAVDLGDAIAQGSGRYRIEPQVYNVPDGIDVRSIDPRIIVVDLQLPQRAIPTTPADANDPEAVVEDTDQR